MDFPIITNENFNTVSNFVNFFPLYSDNVLEYYKKDNQIIFETNFLCCPCIYWYKQDNLWAFSFSVKKIEQWCANNNIELEERTDFSEFGFMWDYFNKESQRSYKYKGINYIEGWKKITLNSDGTFEKENYDLPIFSLELKDNYTLYKRWLLKYRTIIVKANEDNSFIPFINGEIDSRSFTALYKDLNITSKMWYLRENYKDTEELYLQKKEVAKQVLKAINFEDFVHTDTLRIGEKNYMTISDYFHSYITSFLDPNNAEWIYKNIQHSYDVNDVKLNFFSPFLDDIWMMFRQDRGVARCLNGMLLCPDLLNIDLCTAPRGKYKFVDKYVNIIPKAQEILDYWGEENCKNILAEDETNDISDNN